MPHPIRSILIARHNRRVAREYDEARDFIVLHYLPNQREDAEFWRAARELAPPDSLAQTLELYDRTGLVEWQDHSLFGDTAFHSIDTGFQRLPQTPHGMSRQMQREPAWQAMQRIKAANLELARSLPDHGELMRRMHAR